MNFYQLVTFFGFHKYQDIYNLLVTYKLFDFIPETKSPNYPEKKIIKQLNDERMQKRIAAIYTLEEIGRNHPCEYCNIMEILTSFVRNNASILSGEDEINQKAKINTDIQAALNVIIKRDIKENLNNQQVNLSNTDLRGANLQEANLQGANLQGAVLYQANLLRANLKHANLCGAILSAANLCEANLLGANLQGAILGAANLHKANLHGADLEGANLFLANLSDANFD